MINLDIKLILNLTRELEKIDHPNASLIAKEICEFTNNNETHSLEIVEKLSKDMPWEYIRGYAYFKNLKFYVDSRTLIPRIESEQIIDIFKEYNSLEITHLYDVGCGSGAIGITLSMLFPALQVTLIDISKDALEICKKNISVNAAVNTKVLHNDLLEGVSINRSSAIVANLPYIPTNEYKKLQPSVLNYEPESALDGGYDGLKYIKELLEQLKGTKTPLIILEIDPSAIDGLTEVVKKDFSQYRYKFIKDYQGLFRFLKLYL